jgi:Plasmid encoded RepA protein
MSASGRPPRDPFALSAQAVELWGDDTQEIGYLAKVFTQTALPYKDPGNVPVWSRYNGNRYASITLNVAPGFGARGESFGYPFGSMPRLLMTWMSTEAVRTGEQVLPLGETLSDFMRQLGLIVAGGPSGPITRLRDQMRRLFNARISIHRSEGVESCERETGKHLAVASEYDLWWSPKAPEQAALLPSYVKLTAEFFQEVTTRPVPVSLDALRLLRGSPLRLDIYAWLTHRMSYLRQPTVIPWESLLFQFGSGAASRRGKYKFRTDFLNHLGQVIRLAYPAAKVDEVSNGLRLRPSPTHVSRGGRPALRSGTD